MRAYELPFFADTISASSKHLHCRVNATFFANSTYAVIKTTLRNCAILLLVEKFSRRIAQRYNCVNFRFLRHIGKRIADNVRLVKLDKIGVSGAGITTDQKLIAHKSLGVCFWLELGQAC